MSKFFLLPFFLLLAIAAVSEACPQGWTASLRSTGGYCFKAFKYDSVSDNHWSWLAETACNKLGAKLASFDNDFEFKWALGQFKGKFWIGLTLDWTCAVLNYKPSCTSETLYQYPDKQVHGNGYVNWAETPKPGFNEVGDVVYGDYQTKKMHPGWNGKVAPEGHMCGMKDPDYKG